jgi:putative addiction module component (TIGR02574 family)
MIAISELRALPAAQRLRVIEDLWNSIVEEKDSLPDHPAVIAELRARKARFLANPSSGVPWSEAKKRIKSGCA